MKVEKIREKLCKLLKKRIKERLSMFGEVKDDSVYVKFRGILHDVVYRVKVVEPWNHVCCVYVGYVDVVVSIDYKFAVCVKNMNFDTELQVHVRDRELVSSRFTDLITVVNLVEQIVDEVIREVSKEVK